MSEHEPTQQDPNEVDYVAMSEQEFWESMAPLEARMKQELELSLGVPPRVVEFNNFLREEGFQPEPPITPSAGNVSNEA